jgi:hypothetical protein
VLNSDKITPFYTCFYINFILQYVIQMAAFPVILLLMMGMVNAKTYRVLVIKAKIQLHLIGYNYTYWYTMHGTMNLKSIPFYCYQLTLIMCVLTYSYILFFIVWVLIPYACTVLPNSCNASSKALRLLCYVHIICICFDLYHFSW